ncbi:unnamed protein product [Diatraea saccharalis]|uniref:CCHC-type domain-containing protein n=1 Tax=Diatraea saccharalis TaxID=40085 RepID=A0A9N9R3Z4_9NEOP|nr:unnamed protein product [Diatraea saccharalis]
MTRFARAKGSKASNEKAPEDGTPWEVMKEQLVQSQKEKKELERIRLAEKQRLENYQTFLNDQKTQKRKATWCEFPETGNKQLIDQPPKKKSKVKSLPVEDEDVGLNDTKKNMDKNKKKLKKLKNCEAVQSIHQTCVSTETKREKKYKSKAGEIQNVAENRENDTNTTEQIQSISVKSKKNKKKMRNGKLFQQTGDRSFQLIINGKEVDLIKFDGFPIMKKDAERLKELKNSMVKKGIPKSEVLRTIKLERRRAEKALSRLKRDVCYNCRKGGHNLSDCPDLKSKIPGADAAEGICFKCGSTEHKQFECKVQKNMEFKFATCFICKQLGHIARQCPDNPKGLYPDGGCCKLCGDVTHLRRDCPTTNSTKEETSIKLQTLDSNNLEDIAQPATVNESAKGSTKKPKKIKF